MKIINHIRGNYRRYILATFDVCCFIIIDLLFYMSAVGKFITYINNVPTFYDPNELNQNAEASKEMKMMKNTDEKVLTGEQLCIENS